MNQVALLELLRNSLVLHQISPYLSVGSLLNLAATSTKFRAVILGSKETFRFLDLSTAKGLHGEISPIDVGGVNWRHERIDESTTEEDFHAGPIRGVFSFLRRKTILQSVQVLVLDGLSAPAEVLGEIIRDETLQIRILSVVGCKNLNMGKFQQELRYICRPTRSPGTPSLKGVYVFGTDARPRAEFAPRTSTGVTNAPGAQLGASLSTESHEAQRPSGLAREINPWYHNSGMLLPMDAQLHGWPLILQACEGIISFDAVLCKGPRHDASSTLVQQHDKAFLGPQLASVALRGCEICHSLPEGPACSSDAPSVRLPLLQPVPRWSSNIKTAQQPIHGDVNGYNMFARCRVCTENRWCESCSRLWCEAHYDTDKISDVSPREEVPTVMDDFDAHQKNIRSSHLKVHLGLCIEHCLVSEMMAGAGSDGMWG